MHEIPEKQKKAVGPRRMFQEELLITVLSSENSQNNYGILARVAGRDGNLSHSFAWLARENV
jgi:hypothetical protein